MTPPRLAPLALCVLPALCLPLAAAAAPTAPLRVVLRIADACSVQAAAAEHRCAVPHRRSDAPGTAPAQLQALTPPVPPASGGGSERAWLTLTF